MKRILPLLISVAAFLPSHAQQCIWANQSNTEKIASGQAVAVDPSGNVFQAGIYSGTQIVFGTDTLYNPDSASTCTFLVKYDGSGNVLWARSYGGSKSSDASDMVVDGAGNAYLYGNYTGHTLSFDSYTLTNDTTHHDLFLVKVNGSGSVEWAKNIPMAVLDTFQTQWASAMAVSSDGHIAITGTFDSSVTFGSIHLGYGTPSGTAMFLAKYDTAGNAIWAGNSLDIQAGTSIDGGTDVAFDASGNIFVSGWMSGDSVSFGSGIYVKAPASGSNGFFLTKYSASGTAQWATGPGGSSVAYLYPAAIASDGTNVYLAGNFSSPSITIGGTVLTNTTPTTTWPDIFVAKYDGTGAAQWAVQSTGDSLADYVGDIAFFGSTVFIAGESTALPFSFGGYSFSQPGIFIAGLNLFSGSGMWFANALNNNSGNALCNGIVVNSTMPLTENIYTTGNFERRLSFTIPASADSVVLTTPSSVSNDAFLTDFMVHWEGVPQITVSAGDINLYPNPASDHITILSGAGAIASYTITDCRGVRVLNGSLAQQDAEINTGLLAPGLYFATIQTESSVVVKKFVKI